MLGGQSLYLSEIMNPITWNNLQSFKSNSYTCGHCGRYLASEKGWSGSTIVQLDPGTTAGREVFIYVCHHCTRPTFVDFDQKQFPGALYGHRVEGIPDDSILNLYNEARQAVGAGANTAAVLCCRKLLMNIAVAKGAKEGETFISYVKYLSDNHFVPPDASDWVDHIRKKGNEATHEIAIMAPDDAKDLITFIEMLLKVIFEFPAMIKKKMSPPPSTT